MLLPHNAFTKPHLEYSPDSSIWANNIVPSQSKAITKLPITDPQTMKPFSPDSCPLSRKNAWRPPIFWAPPFLIMMVTRIPLSTICRRRYSLPRLCPTPRVTCSRAPLLKNSAGTWPAAMSSALAFYDGYRHGRLPANLLQAQRDYFGAHTYERVDKPRGEFFHTNWTGQGGDVTATTYDA